MTGRQELLTAIVRTVTIHNYRAWLLKIGNPDKKTQSQIDDLKSMNSEYNLVITPYTEKNIFGSMFETNLHSMIDYEQRNMSKKARSYYMNCTGRAFDRFINQVLKEANHEVENWKWAYNHK